MRIYDLRSDTITKPSEGMRKAMYAAEVGDDVFGEDPSVNKLQELACEISGTEASLFLSSGSMGNLIAVFLLCGRGNELLVHEKAHIVHFELCSAAAIAGATPVPIPGERGILNPERLKTHLRPAAYYNQHVKMVALENSHNLMGGTCYSVHEIDGLRRFCLANRLMLHIDGARIFNACLAGNTDLKRITAACDSLAFCLSKGLGAPVGSILCGSKEYVEEARRVRKLLGGGMRQAGILAAAGIYALQNNIDRLVLDHRHAKKIAEALADTSWAQVSAADIETNIVIFNVKNNAARKVVTAFKEHNVLSIALGSATVRFVTSLEINEQDTNDICEIICKLHV